ncbi:MAG: SCO family protein [Proteobacteria bacterium]|nr:SCO family protein [Pseudomonadota bacterium]
MMPAARKTGLLVAALLLIGGVAIAGSVALQRGSGVPGDLADIALAAPVPLAGVTLADAKGPVAFPAGPRGKWTLLALGYTHCPDVCPFMLGNLAEVETRMKERLDPAQQPQFVFISVDPDRDTPALLGEYVGFFSDDFRGMTGPKSEIDRVTEQLGAFYRLGGRDSDGDYGVDHSAEIYLIDPKGRLFGKFRPPLDPDDTAAKFESAQRFFEKTDT